jgi:hypothetical protein
MRCALALGIVAAVTSRATADGVYVLQSVGIGRARGDLEPTVGNAIRTRLAAGARVRWLAVEPWLQSDVHPSRTGGYLAGFVGGDPVAGHADLASYGFDVKLAGPIYRAPTGERVEVYVRGGPFITSATGALDGFRGYGAGMSAGVQLTGEVRALGFLWAPLFLTHRGPKVLGSLYFDQGVELCRLEGAGRSLDARVVHVALGFGVATGF